LCGGCVTDDTAGATKGAEVKKSYMARRRSPETPRLEQRSQ
jgi:hypothetical protein